MVRGLPSLRHTVERVITHRPKEGSHVLPDQCRLFFLSAHGFQRGRRGTPAVEIIHWVEAGARHPYPHAPKDQRARCTSLKEARDTSIPAAPARGRMLSRQGAGAPCHPKAGCNTGRERYCFVCGCAISGTLATGEVLNSIKPCSCSARMNFCISSIKALIRS